uniref:Uncharacterized protein n=1 Tax=Arundo donax TaxID=35708 RepID=A0A0A9BDC1_ARUDO
MSATTRLRSMLIISLLSLLSLISAASHGGRMCSSHDT